jgi:hypothetical protein
VNKNKANELDQTRKPRRLGLNRETVLVLNDPALLELARGGGVGDCPTLSRSIDRDTGG